MAKHTFTLEIEVRHFHIVDVQAENWDEAWDLVHGDAVMHGLPEPTRGERRGDVLLSYGSIGGYVTDSKGGTLIILKAPTGRAFDDVTDAEVLKIIGATYKVKDKWNGAGCGTMSICVGDQQVRDGFIEDELADVLLRRQGWSKSSVDAQIGSKQRRIVNLKKRIPVHISYLTSWVNKDGSVHFRRDVYGRDKKLAKFMLRK